MAITYTWTFPALDVAPSEDGNANVVKVVHWRYSATDGLHSAETYSTATMPGAGNPFTDFALLTPEIVTGWVVAALGNDAVAEMQINLASQIDNQRNPPIVAVPPPWE